MKTSARVVVIGGGVVITDAFDASTTLDFGDSNDTDRYTSTPVDAASAGYTALTITGYKHSIAEALSLLSNQTVTQGAGYVVVHYIQHGRADAVG